MNLSRRQILRGLGGATLALPFLSSMATEKEAQAAFTTRKFFVQMCTEHGGAWGANMYPADVTLGTKLSYAGHEIRRGALSATKAGGRATLSPILRGPDTKLTDRLVSKMNVLRGVDIPFYIGHHTGGHLGNYARNDGNGSPGVYAQAFPMPTIDQLMAWSPNFYSDLAIVRERAIIAGRNLSYNHSNPQSKSGPIQAINASFDSQSIFASIFVPPSTPTRKPIADLVLEDYKRTRNKAGLSLDDQRRLDDHIQRIAELQRRLNVRASCDGVTAPTEGSTSYLNRASYAIEPASQQKAMQLLNDVIVAAFLCGTSRIAVLRPEVTFSSYAGDWHQEIAHMAHLPAGDQQRTIASSYEGFFANVYLDLIAKLDAAEDGAGQSLLDAALVVWTQESGPYTHDNQSMPIVTAGGAGGAIKTGQYCDYRNLGRVVNAGGFGGSTEITHAGLIYNQWLGTALRSMGLEPSEYEKAGVGGYGLDYVDADSTPRYPASVLAARSQLLPFIT